MRKIRKRIFLAILTGFATGAPVRADDVEVGTQIVDAMNKCSEPILGFAPITPKDS